MKVKIETTQEELAQRTPEEIHNAITQVVEDIYKKRMRKAKNERADTPAEPHERIKGSKKNPKGSASSRKKGASIEIDQGIEDALRDKVKEHNEDTSENWQRVTLGTLKAVFRRGAGAFSASHRPSQNRQSWAYARVNAFLKIAMGGGNPKYTQDNDLLSAKHPRRKKADIKKAVSSCGCDTLRKGNKRGGEIDLVLDLSEEMKSLYERRLNALRKSIEEIKVES